MDNSNLVVKVIAQKGVIFEGQATSVSSQNSRGKFDILPFHANFITFIENTSLIVRPVGKKELKFDFPFAIIYNANNSVKVYTDIHQEILE